MQTRFVVHLLVDDPSDLVEHEPKASDQEIVDQEHVRRAPA
jgi:hypothetical protein